MMLLLKSFAVVSLLSGTTAFAPSSLQQQQQNVQRQIVHLRSIGSTKLPKRLNNNRHFPTPTPTLSSSSPPPTTTTALSVLSPVTIAETVCPKLGLLTAFFLFLSPLQAVRETVQVGELCDLNPLPISFMAIVSTSWMVYGLYIKDMYVTLSNMPGAILSVAYAIFLLPVLGNSAWESGNVKSKRELRRMQTVLLGGAGASFGLWTWLRFFSSGMTKAASSTVLGLWASAFTVVLFGSPLTTLQTVIRTRNSSSILFRLSLAQTTNAALWTAYGIVMQQAFVWAPNGVGLILGLIQLAVRIIIPADPYPLCEVE